MRIALAIPAALFLMQTGTQVDWIYQIKNKPLVDPRQYNFTAQTPGGTLTASSPATITMRPCPLGVSGGNTWGYNVLISGGTGTLETVAITGGTCSPGAASGTLTFTPANNHSGAWTVSSSSSGLAEAFVTAPTGSIVQLPPGATNVYGTAWMYYKTFLLQGSAATVVAGTASDIVPQVNGIDVLHTIGSNGTVFQNFNVIWSTKQTAGRSIVEEGSDTQYRYLRFYQGWNDIYIINGGSEIVDHCRFTATQNIGVYGHANVADAGGVSVTNSLFEGSDYIFAAIQIADGGGDNIQGNGFHCFCRFGVLHQPAGTSSQLQIIDNTFDGVYGNGVFIQPTSVWTNYIIKGNIFSNFANDGNTTPFHGATGYQAIWIENTNGNRGIIQGNQIQCWYASPVPSTQLNGILVTGQDWLITDNLIDFCYTGVQVSGAAQVDIGAHRTTNNVTIPLFVASASGGYSVTLRNPMPVTQATLAAITYTDGSEVPCSDCKNSVDDSVTVGATCVGSGHGAKAIHINGTWRCY